MAGIAKAYALTPDYVLYEMSYANVIMYSAVLPSYNTKDDKEHKREKQKVINASDPNNREQIRQFLDSIE